MTRRAHRSCRAGKFIDAAIKGNDTSRPNQKLVIGAALIVGSGNSFRLHVVVNVCGVVSWLSMPDDSRAEAHLDHHCSGWAHVSALELHGQAMRWHVTVCRHLTLAVAALLEATGMTHLNFIDTVVNDREYSNLPPHKDQGPRRKRIRQRCSCGKATTGCDLQRALWMESPPAVSALMTAN